MSLDSELMPYRAEITPSTFRFFAVQTCACGVDLRRSTCSLPHCVTDRWQQSRRKIPYLSDPGNPTFWSSAQWCEAG